MLPRGLRGSTEFTWLASVSAFSGERPAARARGHHAEPSVRGGGDAPLPRVHARGERRRSHGRQGGLSGGQRLLQRGGLPPRDSVLGGRVQARLYGAPLAAQSGSRVRAERAE